MNRTFTDQRQVIGAAPATVGTFAGIPAIATDHWFGLFWPTGWVMRGIDDPIFNNCRDDSEHFEALYQEPRETPEPGYNRI